MLWAVGIVSLWKIMPLNNQHKKMINQINKNDVSKES